MLDGQGCTIKTHFRTLPEVKKKNEIRKRKKKQLKINQGRNIMIIGKAGPDSGERIPCPCGSQRFPDSGERIPCPCGSQRFLELLTGGKMRRWPLQPTMWSWEPLWDGPSQAHRSWNHSLANSTILEFTGRYRDSLLLSCAWFLPTGTTKDIWFLIGNGG